MEFFKNPELIKLGALTVAFVIGVGVCGYVFVKETMEMQQRRAAKRLMYEDEIRREFNRRQMEQQVKAQSNQATESQRQSFA